MLLTYMPWDLTSVSAQRCLSPLIVLNQTLMYLMGISVFVVLCLSDFAPYPCAYDLGCLGQLAHFHICCSDISHIMQMSMLCCVFYGSLFQQLFNALTCGHKDGIKDFSIWHARILLNLTYCTRAFRSIVIRHAVLILFIKRLCVFLYLANHFHSIKLSVI